MTDTASKLYRLLRTYDRSPFLEALSIMLDSMPSNRRLEEFAHDHPDKYVAMLKHMAALGGFIDRVEVLGAGPIEDLSDAALEARIRERAARLSLPAPIDLTPTVEPVEAPQEASPGMPPRPASVPGFEAKD